MKTFIQDLIYAGYSGSQFLLQLSDYIMVGDKNEEFTDAQKAAISMKIASANHQLLEGANELLQMLDVGVTLIKLLKK